MHKLIYWINTICRNNKIAISLVKVSYLYRQLISNNTDQLQI